MFQHVVCKTSSILSGTSIDQLTLIPNLALLIANYYAHLVGMANTLLSNTQRSQQLTSKRRRNSVLMLAHSLLSYINIDVNTLRPRENYRHFKYIFLNKNAWILLKFSIFLNVPIDNITSLVKIMVWRRPGDEPLSEPMMISLLGLNGLNERL